MTTQYNNLEKVVQSLVKEREDLNGILEQWKNESFETKGKRELKQY